MKYSYPLSVREAFCDVQKLFLGRLLGIRPFRQVSQPQLGLAVGVFEAVVGFAVGERGCFGDLLDVGFAFTGLVENDQIVILEFSHQ